MPEEISVQILTQASDNIQKLFELTTRVDERVKSILTTQHELDARITNLVHTHQELMQKVAILESKETSIKIIDCERQLIAMDKRMVAQEGSLDKRMTNLEGASNQGQDRWNRFVTFGLQLVWVCLAAWLLMKLNLQPPAAP